MRCVRRIPKLCKFDLQFLSLCGRSEQSRAEKIDIDENQPSTLFLMKLMKESRVSSRNFFATV